MVEQPMYISSLEDAHNRVRYINCVLKNVGCIKQTKLFFLLIYCQGVNQLIRGIIRNLFLTILNLK